MVYEAPVAQFGGFFRFCTTIQTTVVPEMDLVIEARQLDSSTTTTPIFVPILPQVGHSALIWVELTLCLSFVAARTWVQFHHVKRFYINDYLIFFALICHTITTIVCQVAMVSMYKTQEIQFDVNVLEQLPGPSDLIYLPVFQTYQFVLMFLFFLTLWSVKFSLLFFFWRFFESVTTRVRTFWWAMMAITASTFIVSVCLQMTACGTPQNFVKLGGCEEKPIYKFLSILVFYFSTGADIGGDILVMIIPFPLLYKLNVNSRQKAVLVTLFLLPVIPISFAVLKLVFCYPTMTFVDVIKYQLFALLENSTDSSLAIMTSCLPMLRLFTTTSRDSTKRSSAQRVYYGDTSKFSNKSAKDNYHGAILLETVVESENGVVVVRRGSVIQDW
ncbi:hypothetical protein BKA67DRAFT_640476 [Truncatella angustata]|uniref:Rhodopsin domain-containing protein n=1 Tax=Truncatella angustata TaxID=152316 RepID=A0A9P8UVV4_9PEZI|nr:uncharacterized protein BKA67DRAFT_640476 [Truncatella angustata]KAH6659167.1 hypothetical protein BKA67DRAFT_640476 [Truncatella angustata]